MNPYWEKRAMSHPLSDVEAKLLFDRLNRRTKLLASLTRSRTYFLWFQLLFLVSIVVVSILFLRESMGPEVTLVSTVAGLLLMMIGVSFGILHNRIDTLIELLRQDGLPDSVWPGSREKQRREVPAEGG
jgi:hypothetical protein